MSDVIKNSDNTKHKNNFESTDAAEANAHGEKHGGHKLRTLAIVCVAVILIAGGVFVLLRCGGVEVLSKMPGLDRLPWPESLSSVGLPDDEIDVTDDVSVPKVKLYLKEGRVVEPEKITSANLISSDRSYNKEGGANALYDGNPSTCTDSENEWSTLDAGELKSLAYIRYIPNTSSQELANTCVGTKFLASKDNENFVELGTVMPDVNGDLTPDWHMIEFSGFGEYRYFKVKTPPNASIGEVEWICNNGISADADNNMSIDFMAYEARGDYDALVTLAVYNKDKVLKTYRTLNAKILTGEYTPIEFTNLHIEIGDYIRIQTYDKAVMEQLANAPLDYRFTEASANLSMSNVYSDNMMFQADEELIISGKAPCGSAVTAELKDNDTGVITKNITFARNVSQWSMSLGTYPNGGSYTLTITDGDERLEYNNITFGDVWVFAGQSNMEFYLCGEKSGEELLKSGKGRKQATSSNIRMVNMYNIGINGAWGEIENVPLCSWNEYWTELTPDRASYISAIAYYFAQNLRERFSRNVGIISVAVGDTEINKWYPRGQSNGTFNGTDGRLYNNRIYPFTELKVKGILWYQGEADQYRTNMDAKQYSDAMAGLIDEYRKSWNNPSLPFYYAQITRYGVKDESEIREGQRLALRKVSNSENVGMISLLDIIGAYEQGSGCARSDIHPWQKEVAAQRFLSFAARDLYGANDDVTGPEYEASERVGNTLVLSFRHKGSLRVLDKSQYADSVCDDKILTSGTDTSIPHEFWVSDEDGKLYPAEARIENDKVVVWSDAVAEPQSAVYAWGAYPEMPNLTDDTGLPASTFNSANGSSMHSLGN